MDPGMTISMPKPGSNFRFVIILRLRIWIAGFKLFHSRVGKLTRKSSDMLSSDRIGPNRLVRIAMAIGRVFKLTAPEGTVELMTKGVGSTTDYNDDSDLDDDGARD